MTTKKIDKKIDKKRQAQNRLAQKVFREKNQMKIDELKQKLQELEEMKEIYEKANVKELMDLRKENDMLKHQRLVMISQIDKLRQDNIALSSRSRTRSRATAPRQMIPVKGMPALPLPWTSHRHTFVGSSSVSNTDANSVSTKSSDALWQDSNQYPGYPQWTPPAITKKNLLPQPPPLHLLTKEVEMPAAVLPPMDMLNQINFNYGGGSRPIQAPKAVNQEPFFMPFLPSTNSMVPLYHHMPFESGTRSITAPAAGCVDMFETLNDWWNSDQLSMPLVSRDMAFEPLEVMLNSAISNTASLNHIPLTTDGNFAGDVDLNTKLDVASASVNHVPLPTSNGFGANLNLSANTDVNLSGGLDLTVSGDDNGSLTNISNLLSSGPNGCHSRMSTSANTFLTDITTGSTVNETLNFPELMEGENLTFQDLEMDHKMAMEEAAKLRLANVFTPL